ncbi:MAG TPA: acetylxylan esterase [Abditibacteriaceae bacterium]
MNKKTKWHKTYGVVLLLMVSNILSVNQESLAQSASSLPDHDLRQDTPRTLDTPVAPPIFTTLAAWKQRRAHLQEQILNAAGLLPLPEKTPLHARIFGKLEREGYSIEKVELQTRPGFFLGGNLYRPLGRAEKKFPGIVTPHGHWARGRLHDDALGSIPARCINLARQGYVVFAYDMTGYNDTGLGLNHRGFAVNNSRAALWGISVFGLQTWNSIRALDFLLSLPDVDKTRIGATGASGGGTQTFVLTAIDDRVHVAAPVNMISLHMQGGCVCENAPGLRVDTSNVEIGAMMAPKPLLMVAATGDWTVNTPTKEGPATQQVYRLFEATDHLRWTQIEAPHNYNKQSREAVYGFFNQWLRHENKPVAEQPYHSETDAELRVYPDGKAAPGTLNEKQLIDSMIEERRQQWQKSLPRNAREQAAFRKTFGAALRHSLGVEMPLPTAILSSNNAASSEAQEQTVIFGRVGRGDRIEAQLYGKPDKKRAATLIVSEQIPTALITGLLNSGRVVLHLRPFRFQTPRDVQANFFTTYNRPELSNRVQDILTAVAYLEQRGHSKIELIGVGRAGLATLLARAFAPSITRAVCDVDGLDTALDDSFVTDLAQPSLRRAGDFRTAGILAAPSNLWLHNTQDRFDAAPIVDAYRIANFQPRLKISNERAAESAIVEWLKN